MQYILSVTTRGASLYVSGKKVLAIKRKVDGLSLFVTKWAHIAFGVHNNIATIKTNYV